MIHKNSSIPNVLTLFLLAVLLVVTAAAPVDQNDGCPEWAEMGECENNAGYMLQNCATSCEKIAAQANADAKELEAIGSFFELSAKDIRGHWVDFKNFRGQVTILINVASYCGSTDSHYRGLVRLWSQVKGNGNINILAFPCNQFGEQEPESNDNIHTFALEKYGVDFTMMDKIDVNGNTASIVYKYLKSNAGLGNISWNFATYFVVGPDGAITAHSEVEPMELKDLALGLLVSDEL